MTTLSAPHRRTLGRHPHRLDREGVVMALHMLTTDEGDGAGHRVTPETLLAVRDELRTLVMEAEDFHREASFAPRADVRQWAAEQAEEADDKVLQYLSHILGGA